jgi:tricarballylate dehydrogenase
MTLPERSDVVVVGGGHAGLCAAITAAEEGARVVLLERAPKAMRGGNTRHTRNLRAMHHAPQAGLSGAYDEHEYWQDLLKVTAGHTNESLTRMVIAQSEGLLTWLQERGVRFQPSLSGTLGLGRTNAFFLGGGCALANALYRHAEQVGVHINYDCTVEDVRLVEETCESIRVESGGESFDLTADAFIMASGGFQANAVWMREIWGPAADNFLIRGTPFNDGLVLRALMDGGAATVADASQCHAVAIDARAPKYDGGIVSRLDCVPFGIVVNTGAERFYDEGEDFWPKRYAIWGRLIAAQPDQIAYAIIDSKVTDNFIPSVFPAVSAPTIEALAGQLQLPAVSLSNTLDEYNASVRSGRYDTTALDDCATFGLTPPKSHWALSIDKPPYHAYPLRPGITFTYLGVAVNKRAQVIRADGSACTNLFAAGEIMAGNILGQGYCAGTGMTIGGVFGRIAGAEAACQTR